MFLIKFATKMRVLKILLSPLVFEKMAFKVRAIRSVKVASRQFFAITVVTRRGTAFWYIKQNIAYCVCYSNESIINFANATGF